MNELTNEQYQLITEMREAGAELIGAFKAKSLCEKRLGKLHAVTCDIATLIIELQKQLAEKQHLVEISGALDVLAERVVND